jgi:ABC-type lipoprotein release transport system permease subunit
MALGATALRVLRGWVGSSLRLGAIGAAIGVLLAVGVTRFLGVLLYGVSATDALSFGGALALELIGVLLATLVPAWRAARTSPLTALRHT